MVDNKKTSFLLGDHYKHNFLKSSVLIIYLCIACGFEVHSRWEAVQYNGCFMQQHHTCGTGVNRVVHHPTVQNGAIGWVCVSWSVSQYGDFDLPVEIALIDELFGELKTNHDILHP